jgi:hypothetical protein
MQFWNHDVLFDIQSVLAELTLRITPLSVPLNKGMCGGVMSKGEG